VGRHNVISIAIRYGLDEAGLESWWRQDFMHSSRQSPRAHPAYCTMGFESFPGVKQPGHGVNYPPPTSAEVKEIVEL
jgi:hypothetical protein